MNTSVEVSYYPLNEEYKAPIKDFIRRLRGYDNLIVVSSGMSTQVFGDYLTVMEALTKEMQSSFQLPHSIFILKIINADLQSTPNID